MQDNLSTQTRHIVPNVKRTTTIRHKYNKNQDKIFTNDKMSIKEKASQ